MTQLNFIVIMADDLGYGDLSCMGSEFRTPHLDRLAASGVRFANWYSNAPVCSPSRAALLTGRYPHRAGVTHILSGRRGSVPGLTEGVATFADALREHRGYRTAHVGKWHLGTDLAARPDQHGFDRWFGFTAGCFDYYSHLFYYEPQVQPVHDLWDNGREVYRNGEYATDLFTDEAIRVIRDWTREESSDPFCLYLGYNAPHYPMHAPAEYLDRFRGLPEDRRIMAAMVSCMDDGVGRLLDELDRQGLTEDTCVFFMSDNGPSPESRNWMDGRADAYYGGSAGSFRGHKYSLYEGGVRVPAMLSWPGHLDGGQVLDTPLAAMDIFPTLLTLTGIDPAPYGPDGVDIWPVLKGEQPAIDRSIFWRHHDNAATRRGEWKLVRENGTETLHNLADDLSEKDDLIGQEPAIADELRKALHAWEATIP
jgi:arylsulfatase A-like enzyme